jgi:hypothetical protein
MKNQPGLRSILLDFPEVCQIAKSYKGYEGLKTYPCDIFRNPFPNNADPEYGYQAVFLGNILHIWNETICCKLLQKCFNELPSKGVILIHEALLNDDGDGPLLTALFSFNMFVYCKSKQFTFNEMKSMLEKCDFTDVKAIKAYGFYSLVSAIKP